MRSDPYGQWPSPISAGDLGQASLRRSEGFVDDGKVYWLQSNPAEKGRTSLVTLDENGELVDLTPQWDCRTSIHAYGGNCVAIQAGQVCFYDRTTSRVWAGPLDGELFPITGEGPWVFGGLSFLNNHQVVCVREDHSDWLNEHEDTLVVLDLAPNDSTGGTVIASGADFYFSPAVSANGWIAWMEYDHPSMPWGTTRILAQSPQGRRHIVSDAIDVSAVHPQWDSDGTLVFLSDESGFWNFYRWTPGEVTRLNDHDMDFCEPVWVLSTPPYALLTTDHGTRIGCTWWEDGFAHLGCLEPDGTLSAMGVYGTATLAPANHGQSVVLLGSPTAPTSLNLMNWETQVLTTFTAEQRRFDDDCISAPTQVSWSNSAGTQQAYGWFYPPTPSLGNHEGSPPVIVMAHGGPTAYSPALFSLTKQFFTSRGIAILDVNYSGSATMGRAYRDRLNNNWGVLDVSDCVDGAQYLVSQGLVDPSRMAMMGGSAGGFTTLAALTTTNVFSAGISMYGIADLEALVHDTIKFEAHYTQSLVADYPQERSVYVDRSPITHVD
ncbi:MAG: prolyl oligopeptidase family serine peptidase, partial [Propionibacteriaceae bacterium]|nr:prolyl oligopeptidase family serine peptidase [Propionibacteriaceae bacterium]